MAAASWMLWGVIALSLIGYFIYQQWSVRDRRRLPPGPKPLPILGNIKDFPPEGTPEFQHWLKHKDLYGGISSVSAMGATLVIVHDKEAAHELLEKNAGKTSSRPPMVMGKLCGYDMFVVSQDFNSQLRRSRKYLLRELGSPSSAGRFRDIQEVEVKRQLVRGLNEPGKWMRHYKTTTAATVLNMAYGYTIEPRKPDVLVKMIEKSMAEFAQAASPFSWAVDIFPILQYLPENFPGGSFKKKAREWRKSIIETTYTPYRFVQRQMATLTHRKSYVSELVQQLKQEGTKGELSREDEDAVVWSAVSLYGAATDTTAVTLRAFALAMTKFGHVQRKAQEEIDRVVGTDRLPTFEDRESLPYVNAVVKEALRWWAVIPMGIPHTATEDIECKGFVIPKGATILANVWWFLHDPAVYADPASFDPDRFLAPRNEPDPGNEAFGYGRRVCPGRFFAENSLYINIAQTLAAFDISKAVGKDGKEVDHEIKAQPGAFAGPVEFEFRIRPRSEKHAALIRQLEREIPWDSSDAEFLESVKDHFDLEV